MEYRIFHVPINPRTRSGAKMSPVGITIHSTANPKSTAINERNWLINPNNNRTASWHIAVDEKMAVEAIPLNEKAWHASSSIGNNSYIGIEMCESGNRAKVIDNTVKLVAQLLHERGWGVGVLRRHYDWNKKNCPRILNYNNWEGWTLFKYNVQKELDKLKGKPIAGPVAPPINKPQVDSTIPSTWAVEHWNWAKTNNLSDGSRPKGELTREEFVTMLKRFHESK